MSGAGSFGAARPELRARGEAGWLEGEAGALFCWYHPPRMGPPARAVLICDPLGPDRMNLHLTHRALAQRLAAAGLACLRFDPLGTGDSSGSPRDPGWPGGWWRDARRAAAYLLARSGARSLAVFGARFGGTLAASFAAGVPEVEALVAWGPDPGGQAFLRRERALERLVDANPAGRRRRCQREGDEEYLGFVYPSEAREILRGVRLDGLALRPGLRVKLVAWDADADSDESGLAGPFERAGARVELSRPEGFESDASIDAQRVPEALLDEVVDWLGRLDDASSPVSSGVRAEADDVPSAGALVERARVARGAPRVGEVAETALHFGRDGDLFGILCEPLPSANASAEGARSPALVLVNGGNNHRAGINRNYTEWARERALAGATTLRFDIRGLGDSPPRRPEDLNRLYRDETRADVIEAIDEVCRRTGRDRVVLAGLCAGAYQAFHAARVDARVEGLVLLDLLRWDPDPVDGDPATWLARRPRGVARRLARLKARFGPGAPTLLARGLLELVERGTRVLAVSTEQGGSVEAFRDALGRARGALEASGRFELESLRDTNHIFGPLWSQEWVGDRLGAFLETLAGESAAGGPGAGASRARVGTDASPAGGSAQA